MPMSELDTALRAHTDRLIAELGSMLAPEQIERTVQESAARSAGRYGAGVGPN